MPKIVLIGGGSASGKTFVTRKVIEMLGVDKVTHLSIDEELGMGATIAKIMMDLELINKALDRFGYDVPIYDIDTFEKLDSSSSVRMLLKNK